MKILEQRTIEKVKYGVYWWSAKCSGCCDYEDIFSLFYYNKDSVV